MKLRCGVNVVSVLHAAVRCCAQLLLLLDPRGGCACRAPKGSRQFPRRAAAGIPGRLQRVPVGMLQHTPAAGGLLWRRRSPGPGFLGPATSRGTLLSWPAACSPTAVCKPTSCAAAAVLLACLQGKKQAEEARQKQLATHCTSCAPLMYSTPPRWGPPVFLLVGFLLKPTAPHVRPSHRTRSRRRRLGRRSWPTCLPWPSSSPRCPQVSAGLPLPLLHCLWRCLEAFCPGSQAAQRGCR